VPAALPGVAAVDDGYHERRGPPGEPTLDRIDEAGGGPDPARGAIPIGVALAVTARPVYPDAAWGSSPHW
jgi:hypothetical protein